MGRWLIVVVAVAFGCHDEAGRPAPVVDGPAGTITEGICRSEEVSAACGGCSVLAQTWCYRDERCTWFHDDQSDPPIGHIGCAPSGTVAEGEACAYGEPGAYGFDDCVIGTVCVDGTCHSICDHQGGAPTCPVTRQCTRERGLFGPAGGTTPPAAGICTEACDPLADNDALGSGSMPGTRCTASEGCYGLPHTEGVATTWQCETATSTAVHGEPPVEPAFDGCAPGYEPFLSGPTGTNQFTCLAICTPGNAYLGNPGVNQANGVAPHACNSTDARGAFGAVATDATNGEHCMYSWRFELDASGKLRRSPTSDTVGFCVDHTTFRYDSNDDGEIDANDAFMPACSALPLVDPQGGPTAADFGCIDSITGNVMARSLRPRLFGR